MDAIARRPRLQEGVHVNNGTRWSLEQLCRRLGMTHGKGIDALCQREGVEELCWLTHERACELIEELRALGEEEPLSEEDRARLAECANRAIMEGRYEEAKSIRASLALDGQGPAYWK